MPNPNNNSVQDKFITLGNLERYNDYVYPDEMSWDEYQEIEPEAGKTYFIYDYDAGQSAEAIDVTYDNTSSSLQADNVQDAIDEVNSKVVTSDATTLTHGLMSASDKTKLNNIATGANATTVSTSSNAQGAISVNVNGTASNVGLKGIYFGRAGSINDLSTTNSVEGGSVSITIDQPFTSFSPGDRLVVFFYNEYVYDLGDADTYEVTLYVNGSSIGIPVLRSVSLIPLKVTSKLPLKQGLAYTFTYANVTPVGNCFVVNEIPDTTVKYTGTSSGWTGMTKNERKTYDIAYITND